MSFKQKQDKFGLENESIVTLSTEDGEATQNVEAMGEDGSVVANEVFGHTASPTCSYAIKASVAQDVVLGKVTQVGDKYYALTELTLGSSAGGYPTLTAKGEEVPNGTQSCTYTIPNGLTVLPKCHAQILCNAFTYGGSGVHLTDCNVTFTSSFVDSTKDGNRLAWDITQGKVELQCSFVSTNGIKPELEFSTGWQMTSPLNESNPDSNYPTYTCTVTKYLSKDK